MENNSISSINNLSTSSSALPVCSNIDSAGVNNSSSSNNTHLTDITNNIPINNNKTPTRKVTSWVWLYFEKLENLRVKCKTCNVVILRESNSTSVLSWHLHTHKIYNNSHTSSQKRNHICTS